MQQNLINLFRMPIDKDHAHKTLEKGVLYNDIQKFLTEGEKKELCKMNLTKPLKCWGSLPGSSNWRNWNLLKEDDEILCYRSNKYVCLAIVGLKIHNKELAKYLWGERDGETWELMYFFKNIIFFDIPIEKINVHFGFKSGPVMGFNIISRKISEPFIIKFGSLSQFIKSGEFKEQITKEQSEQKIIESPYEAQYYLVQLGKILGYKPYVPSTDSGREAFGVRLRTLVKTTKEDLSNYIGPAILDTISNIDVIWLNQGSRPAFCYEIVYKTGMKEAFARLGTAEQAFNGVKNRIIGDENMEFTYDKTRRLYFPYTRRIEYRDFTQLLEAHTSAVEYQKKVIEEFLGN